MWERTHENRNLYVLCSRAASMGEEWDGFTLVQRTLSGTSVVQDLSLISNKLLFQSMNWSFLVFVR